MNTLFFLLIAMILMGLTSCQPHISDEQNHLPQSSTQTGSGSSQNSEISRIISCSGATTMEVLPTQVSRLNLFIDENCTDQTIDEKNWEILARSHIEYLYFEPTEYRFSLREYTLIASLDALTIAGLEPETKEQGIILRNGPPLKLYEPTGNPLIYSDEERKMCEGTSSQSTNPVEQKLLNQKSVQCFLSLPKPK